MKIRKTGFGIVLAMILSLAGCAGLQDSFLQNVETAKEKSSQGALTEKKSGIKNSTDEIETEVEVEEGEDEKAASYTLTDLAKAGMAVKGSYYFETLSEKEQVVYQEVYLSVIKREEVKLSTLDVELLDKVYRCMMNDNPEIFYSSGYVCTRHTVNGEDVALTFSAKYEMEPEEVKKRQALIDSYVSKCMAGMPKTDQYGQIKYIYDYLIEHTEYDLDAEDNQNICSVFINGKSVCQGYAEATQYLLQKLGYPATIVAGTAQGGSHAWNLVQADGAYYYLDTTWGDVDYQSRDGKNNHITAPVNYDYFLITTSQLEKTHDIDTIVPMPECTAMEDNYYIREGLYFTTLDTQKISQCFSEAYAGEQVTITLKASEEAVFMELKDYLLEQQRIFDYIHSEDSISYYEDTNMNTICFWL